VKQSGQRFDVEGEKMRKRKKKEENNSVMEGTEVERIH
jgi:hypothetical protein